jgi:hypothetical protein
MLPIKCRSATMDDWRELRFQSDTSELLVAMSPSPSSIRQITLCISFDPSIGSTPPSSRRRTSVSTLLPIFHYSVIWPFLMT